MKRQSDYGVRWDAYHFQGIGFESPPEKHRQHACHTCGSTVTARQADGRWGCWYHLEIQLVLVAA